MLDITPLNQAIAQVEESLAFAASPEAKANERLFMQFRASSIQAFEYTYGLAFKFMRRGLEWTIEQPSTVDSADFREILRMAWEAGYINNVDRWITYRQARNKTSHTYATTAAEEVFAVIPDFLRDTIFLRDQIRKRLG